MHIDTCASPIVVFQVRYCKVRLGCLRIIITSSPSSIAKGSSVFLLIGEKAPLTSEESLATMVPPPSTSTSTPAPAARRGNVTIIANLLGSRSLGLDWGHKKIGVALSAGFSERPIGTIPNGGKLSTNVTINRPTLDEILGILRHEAAERIVIGNPLFR